MALQFGNRFKCLFENPAFEVTGRNRGGRCELIVPEFRQLAGSEHHVVPHQERRIDFGIAMLVGVEVEHELADRALQPRQAFLQHDKTRAAQFCRGLEIHGAERLAEIVVRLWREGIVARRSEHVTLYIALLVEAVGHLVQRQIRNLGKRCGEFFIRLLCRQLELRQGGLKFSNFGHER